MTDEPFTFLAWDLDVPNLGEVWLRGEDASGYPTQTWLNGVLLEREPAGKFDWSLKAGVPTPVYEMDRTSVAYPGHRNVACSLIRQAVDEWGRLAGDLSNPTSFQARYAAYSHYGRKLMERMGCP